jgi:hypothetical protein
VSLILGAVPSLLGIIFILVQAAVFTSGDTDVYGAVAGASSLLSGLFGLAAVIVGIVALTRRGASKTLAAAGLALGAAAIVGVLTNALYGAVINLMYNSF